MCGHHQLVLQADQHLMATFAEIEAMTRSLCAPLGIASAVQLVRSRAELDVLTEEAFRHLRGAERTYFLALKSSKRQAEYCAGRIALKRLLSLPPFEIDVSRLEIIRASNGAPRLQCEGERPCVSISHSGGFAVAVAARFPLGVDLEQEEPRPDAFIRYFLSAREQVQIGTVGAARRAAAINRLWSKKEAVSKVYGWGSSLLFRDLDCSKTPVMVGTNAMDCVSASRAGFVLSVAFDSSISAGQGSTNVEQPSRAFPRTSADSQTYG